MMQKSDDQLSIVRGATQEDHPTIARINVCAFRGNAGDPAVAECMISSLARADATQRYFVLTVDDKVVGYALWRLEGGMLREEPVLEFEQTAIAEDYRGKGFSSRLSRESLNQMTARERERNPRVAKIVAVVWLYASNVAALQAYRRIFPDVRGARVQYGDRLEIMLARTLIAQPLEDV